jgi:hypothetical protein
MTQDTPACARIRAGVDLTVKGWLGVARVQRSEVGFLAEFTPKKGKPFFRRFSGVNNALSWAHNQVQGKNLESA